jgi:hypothetical protein
MFARKPPIYTSADVIVILGALRRVEQTHGSPARAGQIATLYADVVSDYVIGEAAACEFIDQIAGMATAIALAGQTNDQRNNGSN